MGGAAFVAAVVFLMWFCFCRSKSASRTSETGSSEPSCPVGKSGGIELSIREARRFDWEELSTATRKFSEQSLIGIGKFGEVYKGLLTDGALVAIKKRAVAPTQEFVEEVRLSIPDQELIKNSYAKNFVLCHLLLI